MKTAIVIGATGLTGRELVRLLLADDRFNKVKVFVRRPTGIIHEKLEEHVIDFDNSAGWKELVSGDVLFSALGTTLKKAGGKAPQYKVDYIYQYQFAKAASENAVPVYVLVSSAYASPDSKIFYSRIKGELEKDIKLLPFKSIHIFQPGPLWGERDEKRTMEEISVKINKLFNRLGILRRFRPIHGRELAQAMINVSLLETTGVKTYVLDEIFKL